ncbi:hypothetical protein [Burkholderia perseverans]|uniref:hypothetical protein n=1 Tax=Burkholderia perseverans TaxID=2615214 RepID=UPI001FED64DB|nr:hypothetical protein [Burkholderia perseverans]
MRVDTALFDSQVEDHVQRQLPFAASVALNKTANVAKQALADEMCDVFDRPTPYTLRSLRVRRATKRQLVARVGFIDESFKGTPASVIGTRTCMRIQPPSNVDVPPFSVASGFRIRD